MFKFVIMLHKIKIYLIAALATISIGMRAEEPEENYYSLMGDADKAISDGKWDEAEDLLRRAMRKEPSKPSNVLLLSNLGMVQFYDGRDNEAIATLTDAHNIAPASVTVLMNRARVYTSTGQPDLAVEDYSRVIRLDSTLTEPRFYRAMLRLNARKIQEASADIDTLAMMAPSDRLTNVAQATVLMAKADFKAAIPHLSTAIKLQPDASYYSSRALCYLYTDDPAAAADDIAHGIELDPTDGELYLYRAVLNKMRYRPDDAKADAEKAVKFGVNPALAKALLGD